MFETFPQMNGEFATPDDYGVGLYNPQSNDAIYGKDIEIMKYKTESTDDVFCDWDNIVSSIKTLDSEKEEQPPERVPSSLFGLRKTASKVRSTFNVCRFIKSAACLRV